MAPLTSAQVINLGDYLKPGFNTSSLTVAQLRGVLNHHSISYPTHGTKSHLIRLFNDEIKSRSESLQKEHLDTMRARPRCDGVVDGLTGRPLRKQQMSGSVTCATARPFDARCEGSSCNDHNISGPRDVLPTHAPPSQTKSKPRKILAFQSPSPHARGQASRQTSSPRTDPGADGHFMPAQVFRLPALYPINELRRSGAQLEITQIKAGFTEYAIASGYAPTPVEPIEGPSFDAQIAVIPGGLLWDAGPSIDQPRPPIDKPYRLIRFFFIGLTLVIAYSVM